MVPGEVVPAARSFIFAKVSTQQRGQLEMWLMFPF